jgi:hypothetical protein
VSRWSGWAWDATTSSLLLIDVCPLPAGQRGNVFDPASVEVTWRNK